MLTAGANVRSDGRSNGREETDQSSPIGVRRPRRVRARCASAQGVKIGILNDQSGTYADYGGKGSVEAAKMAIEDFGGSVLGQKIELVTPITRTSPISPATSRAAGMTPKAST